MLDVLEALIQSYSDGVDVHGWALMKAVGRTGPTVYGVLDRLEDMGWVNGRWEDGPVEGRPRRRLYRLTPDGFADARSLWAERRPQQHDHREVIPQWRPGLAGMGGSPRGAW